MYLLLSGIMGINNKKKKVTTVISRSLKFYLYIRRHKSKTMMKNKTIKKYAGSCDKRQERMSLIKSFAVSVLLYWYNLKNNNIYL